MWFSEILDFHYYSHNTMEHVLSPSCWDLQSEGKLQLFLIAHRTIKLENNRDDCYWSAAASSHPTGLIFADWAVLSGSIL